MTSFFWFSLAAPRFFRAPFLTAYLKSFYLLVCFRSARRCLTLVSSVTAELTEESCRRARLQLSGRRQVRFSPSAARLAPHYAPDWESISWVTIFPSTPSLQIKLSVVFTFFFFSPRFFFFFFFFFEGGEICGFRLRSGASARQSKELNYQPHAL